MQVFIDTSAIVAENYFRSGSIRLLLKAARFLGIEIFVPEIVIDEVKGQFASKLRERTMAFNRAQKQLSELIEFDTQSADIRSEYSKFCSWIDLFVRRHGVVVLPYPEVTMQQIVRESYRAEKPFGKSDKGFKDFIIWKAISSYLIDHTQCVDTYFVTNNTSDFCEKTDGGFTLHPELLAHIDDQTVRITVHTSIKGLFSEIIYPLLNVRELSDIPGLSADDVTTEAEAWLERDLFMYSVNDFSEFICWNDANISNVFALDISGWRITDLDDEHIFVSVTGTVDFEVVGSIYRDDFDPEGPEATYVSDIDWSESEVLLETTAGASFRLGLSYNRERQEIDGHALELEE